MADVTGEPTPSADIQDPLPETNWLWRRAFSFGLTVALLWLSWAAVDRLAAAAMLSPTQGIPALLTALKWIVALNGMIVSYYMLAPSAEQITKLVSTAGLLKSGVTMRQKAEVSTPGGATAATETVTGPTPPVPGPEVAERPLEEPQAAPRPGSEPTPTPEIK